MEGSQNKLAILKKLVTCMLQLIPRQSNQVIKETLVTVRGDYKVIIYHFVRVGGHKAKMHHSLPSGIA